MLGLADVLYWSPPLKIIACTFHSVAIACTIFRLMYRWYMACFWWEDGWAVFALACDIPCLVSAALQEPATGPGIAPPIDRISDWISAMGFTTVLWACRTSILCSIIRVANLSHQHRRIVHLVGGSFLLMWVAMMAQKVRICLDSCSMDAAVGLSQLLTTVVADTALVALPVWFLRRTKMTPRQRIMLFPVFSASFLITLVTIFHSIVLFTVHTDGTIVIAHVKTAVSLIVCNLLVIVTFMYRVCGRGKAGDLDAPEAISLTNVDLNTGFTESMSSDKQTTGTIGDDEASVSGRSFVTASTI